MQSETIDNKLICWFWSDNVKIIFFAIFSFQYFYGIMDASGTYIFVFINLLIC